MDRRRQQMVELIRRHPAEVVLEHQLRNNLISEGLVAEFKEGVCCMGPGCDLCVVFACPTCGRVGKAGEAVFLVDHKPFVLLGDQAVVPHASEPVRSF